jgi:hypothetical protein
MIKTTPWKEYREGSQTYRIQAKYGLDYEFARRNNQAPYFSITATIEWKDSARPHHWREHSGGQLHEEVARHFPTLAPYLRWHLVSTAEPMHYIANAKYWWERAMGIVTPGTSPASPGEPDPRDAFKRTVILGGIPGEQIPYTDDWNDIEKWLRKRLPKLMETFRHAMTTLGVLE